MTPHGKQGRYKRGCRCTKCTAWAGHRDIPDEVRWPFHFIRNHRERLELWFSDDEIKEMRTRGLSDQLADNVAVMILGVLPYDVWPGWLERGLDDDIS